MYEIHPKEEKYIPPLAPWLLPKLKLHITPPDHRSYLISELICRAGATRRTSSSYLDWLGSPICPFFLDTVCYGLLNLITLSQLIGLLSECVKNSNLDIPDPKGVYYSIGYGDVITPSLASESCRFTSRGMRARQRGAKAVVDD